MRWYSVIELFQNIFCFIFGLQNALRQTDFNRLTTNVIRMFLNPHLFHSGYVFRPNACGESGSEYGYF